MFVEASEEAKTSLRSWPALLMGLISFAALGVFSCFPEPLMALLVSPT